MRRGWWHWLSVGVMVVGAVAAPAQAASEVEILLNTLVRKGLLTQGEADDVRREVMDTKDARTAALAKEIVPEWTKRFNWSGDVRLRHESFWRDGSPDRHRERYRLRLGLKGKVSDQLEVGARLATGTDLNPISAFQSAENIFDRKDFFLDQVYVKVAVPEPVPMMLWGGKFETPFSYSPLVWDSDIALEGLAAAVKPAWGPVEFATTGGIFPIEEIGGNAEDPLLFIGQTAATWTVAKEAAQTWLQHLKVKGAFGYYDFRNLKSGIDTTGSNRFGNTAHSSSSATTTVLQYDFDEVDLLGEISSQVFGQPLTLYADYVKNTAVAEADEGYQLGLKLGKVVKPWTWETGYFWQRLEADAVVGQFADSSFGEGGTDRKGHAFYAQLGTLKNSLVRARWFITEQVSRKDRAIDRLQVDWETKF